MTLRTKYWLHFALSIPALIAFPCVCGMLVMQIYMGFFNHDQPIVESGLAFVMSAIFAVGLAVVILAVGRYSLRCTQVILIAVASFDILALPVSLGVQRLLRPPAKPRAEFVTVTTAPAAANLTGTWTGTWTDPKKKSTQQLTFRLEQSGNTITGTFTSDAPAEFTILNGTISGNEVNIFYDLKHNFRGAGATLLGTLKGDTMTGKYHAHQQPKPGYASSGPWQITRVKDETGK